MKEKGRWRPWSKRQKEKFDEEANAIHKGAKNKSLEEGLSDF